MLFLINKNARMGTTYKIFFKVLLPILKKMRLNFDYKATDTKEKAINIIKQAVKNGQKIIIVCGGDGTINTALQHIVGSETILGILPMGSANDFAESALGIPLSPAKALKVLLKHKHIPVDVGMANEILFLNVFGIGIDAKVTGLAHNHSFYRELLVKELRYGLPLVQELNNSRPIKARVIISGKTVFEGKMIQFSVFNGKREGGYFYLNKEGSINDGLLDIFIIEDMPVNKRFDLVLKIMAGEEIRKIPGVYVFKSDNIKVQIKQKMSAELPIQVDGEPANLERDEIDINVLKQKLQIITG